MAQQTAVQMLLRYIKQHGLDLEYEMEMSFLDHEKEQIRKAYNIGYEDAKCNHINDVENYINDLYYLNSEGDK